MTVFDIDQRVLDFIDKTEKDIKYTELAEFIENNIRSFNKGKGKVNVVFDDIYQNLTIKSCIGHVRYATSGESMSPNVVKINEVQRK